MAMHQNLPIYPLCYQLVVQSMAFQRDMPRGVKQTLGQDIYRECMAMCTLIARANAARTAQGRVTHLQALAERLDTARTLIRVAHDTRVLGHKAFAQACQLIEAIGRQAGGWLRAAPPAAAGDGSLRNRGGRSGGGAEMTIIERADPDLIDVMAGAPGDKERHIESDHLIRSGMCPNGHGLMTPGGWGQECPACGFTCNTPPELTKQ